MKDQILDCLQQACLELYSIGLDEIDITRPEDQFGDYAVNLALQLSKKLNQNPREIAEVLSKYLIETLPDEIKSAEVAGPGFINITLTNAALVDEVQAAPDKQYSGKDIITEYSDPNPFKILHIGHVYTTVVGDAIANLLEDAGATVHRINYGGDVGLHVARTIYKIVERLGGENPEKLNEIAEAERPAWLSSAYVEGNNAYEQGSEEVKDSIKELNKKIYAFHTSNDHESDLAKIYWTCREWSYTSFDEFYALLGTKMEKYYPESQISGEGLELVKQNIGKVFTESDGAIVYDGESKGLHTRVFINSQGLPTYEAKEVGLIVQKDKDYHSDKSIIITANEQAQYMAVVFMAISEFLPELTQKSQYISHGMVKLAGGVKMSSRLGNIIRATDLINITAEVNKKLVGHEDMKTTLGAIKYAFLKRRLGGDFAYDPEESVSLEGNSGPYLQYAHARACSILSKADKKADVDLAQEELGGFERSLLKKLGEYSEVKGKALNELLPHHICTYLYELAQVFNRFYENSRVINDPRQNIRLYLVERYSIVLKSGLELLGIDAPDHL
jgi:arginyl-tRNA synthetase